MPNRRIKNKWCMPDGWKTPRGRYRELKMNQKRIDLYLRNYEKLKVMGVVPSSKEKYYYDPLHI